METYYKNNLKIGEKIMENQNQLNNTYMEIISQTHKEQSKAKTPLAFYQQELRQYKKMYLVYMDEITNKHHDEYTRQFLAGFAQYYKHFAQYYTMKLAKMHARQEKAQKSIILEG